MDVPAVTTKKSRAKSCTACRQVKLRCDVREKYPAPCSRCIGRNLECRMDPNFKRVRTRSLSHARSEVSTIFQSSNTPQSMEHHDFEPQSALRASLPDRSATLFPGALDSETWFDRENHSSEQELLSSYKLGDAMVDGGAIVDLYQQFQDLYYFHFPILEPMTSLPTLHKESPALFWAIVMTTSRFHPRHAYLYPLLLKPFEQLLGSLFLRVVQNLKDFQALLLMCQWPLEVNSQQNDPAWMHVGFVVSASMHMGLDKVQNEVLMSQVPTNVLSSPQSARYRWRTWLKVFQISTQLSTWHGLRPPISSPSVLQQLTGFYERETNRELVAATEIQRQMVRNATTLNDFSFHGPQATILASMIQDFDAIKARFIDVWSDSLTINLEAVKLYTLEHCIILADEQLETASLDAEHFVAMALQMGHGPAISLIQIIRQQCLVSQPDPFCGTTAAGGAPLLSHPKQHLRVAFYACLFLLQYLDHTTTASNTDLDAARTAVAALHRLFMQYPSREQLGRGGRTIEVIARSVIPGQRRLRTIIKTRMGGSLNFNAVWLAFQLRKGENPGDLPVPPDVASFYAQSASIAGDPDKSAAGNSLLDPVVSAPQPDYFPWGIWDDQVYDDLGFNLSGRFFPTFSSTINPF